MVIGFVAKEILKQVGRYYRLEGKAFNRLYTGFPQSKTIGRGVRHGLTVGSISGSLISDDPAIEEDGFPQKQPFTSRKQYKTRSRYSGRSNNRYFGRTSTGRRCRCPSPHRRL